MPLDRLDFENLQENDLIELLNAQVPEGLYLDYKRDMYGNTNDGKQELLKDVSAFANAHGGHLIIGMDEQGGIPIAIDGIATADPDQLILWLEQLMRDGIEPRMPGVRSVPVRLTSGSYCFVVRVPRSWNPPHRIRLRNVNRFHIRNSTGIHEASMDELRDLFTLGLTTLERARTFRKERIDTIISRRGSRPLQAGGRLVLHIIPLSAFASTLQIDLAVVHQHHMRFSPINSMGMTPRFNFEGFINERGGETNLGYTQIFRNGILEATLAKIINERNGYVYVHGPTFESRIFNVLSSYINGLHLVGVPAPLVIMLTLEGVEGICYDPTVNMLEDYPPSIDRPVLFLPEGIVTEYAEDIYYHRALQPAFDALWNAAGRVRAMSFDQEGRWVGRR